MTIEFSFFTIILAIGKLFVLICIGYLLYYHKFFDNRFVDKLSLFLVNVIFPALIIVKTIKHFSFTSYDIWWFLPLCAIIFSFLGIIIGYILFRGFEGFNAKKEFICSCAFHNCGYLPMNIILFSFADNIANKLLVFLFLFIFGFNVLMWSFVPLFFSKDKKFSFKIFLNPPVLATIFSLLWVFFIGQNTMPDIFIAPISQLGKAAFPIAMIVLGAYLCKHKAYSMKNKIPVIVCVATKLILFPLIVFIALRYISLGNDYKFFLFLQSIMPTAVSLVIIGSYTSVNNKFLSSSIFYSHVISIFTIPIWLFLYKLFSL